MKVAGGSLKRTTSSPDTTMRLTMAHSRDIYAIAWVDEVDYEAKSSVQLAANWNGFWVSLFQQRSST